MEFVKYHHLERFGTSEVEGIEIGQCYVFPKIDGTNSQLWESEETGLPCLYAGSRNRELELDNDNAGFYNWACEQKSFAQFFRDNKKLKLYGEWLVPHTLKTYVDSAWRKFYVFDVTNEDGYLHYDEYSVLLEKYNIDYIPPLCIINNPTYEQLLTQLENNTFLIKDGAGAGEGIVIKNYNYINKFHRITWAKMVRNEFKTIHRRIDVPMIEGRKVIEGVIVNKYVTQSLLQKEHAKIILEKDGWSSKYIPMLLGIVYYSLINEECWNFVKENKNPTINFKTLQTMCTIKIKELMPELFLG